MEELLTQNVLNTIIAETPITRPGATPLLVVDVWEHAYYIDYRNMRRNAVDDLWRIIDWRVVEDRYNNIAG